jgi:hypothetical protein
MAHHTAHDKLGSVESNEDGIHVFSKSLDDWDVTSLCKISGVRISGRQFFPRERIRETKQLFDVEFTITIMERKLQLENESVLGTDISEL